MTKSARIFTLLMAVTLFFTLSTSATPFRSGTAVRGFEGINRQFQPGGTQSAWNPRQNIPIQKTAHEKRTSLPPSPSLTAQPQEEPAAPLPSDPGVKGIYLTSWMTGNNGFMKKIIAFTAHTEINSVVIDIKDDSGLLSYPSAGALAREIGAGIRKFDPVKVLTLLKQNHIYPIARIVVFKDPLLAQKRPDLAVQSSQGGVWRDKQGLLWVDPHLQKVWEYNVGIAKEAAQLGFEEIQFDYVRFTSDGPIQYCRYPGADGRPKADVIGDFLKYAYQELHPLGVKISADLFGLTCSARDDLGIGQVLEKIAPHVDIICPMVYPSHYPKGVYRITNPDAAPYQTVFQSLSFAKKRLDALTTTGRRILMRPWLQDFSLRQVYLREQLLAQIKAVKDAGFEEYIFWNPSNKYVEGKYRSKAEALDEETVTPSPTPTPSPLATPLPSQPQSAVPGPVTANPQATTIPPGAEITPGSPLAGGN